MTTIRSRDGKLTVHGCFVNWVDDHGGFIFDAPCFRNRYCNTDFWQIIESNPFAPTGKIAVERESNV